MIELKTYYGQTAHKNEYYIHKYEKLLYSSFTSSFWIVDEDEAIEIFKELVMPYNSSNPMIDIPNDEKFIYICNYLYDKGFYIEQFPKFLERPTERWNFSYNMIREEIIKKKGYKGSVSWASRREFVNSLNFIRRNKLVISEDINKILKDISTRNSNFLEMEVEEKLEVICNSIEYLLKPKSNGKFIELDYSDSFGYLSDDLVKKFRNRLECFRHSTKEDLEVRKQFSSQQKEFLISFGLVIVDFLNFKTNNKE